MNAGSDRSSALFAIQASLLLIAGIMFALLPSSTGRVLAVPIFPHGGLLSNRDTGVRIVAAGPIAGSLVISGRHPAFMSALFGHGTLLLPAYPLLCGELPDTED